MRPEKDLFTSILDKSNEKGGCNIGTKCHKYCIMGSVEYILGLLLQLSEYLTVTDQKLVSYHKYIFTINNSRE